MSNTNHVIDNLKTRFDPQAAEGMHETFQFHISDADDYFMTVEDGTLDIQQGEHDDPSVSFSTDSDTLKDVMNGKLNGMQAFMTGRLKAHGNLMLATKLTQLFP